MPEKMIIANRYEIKMETGNDSIGREYKAWDIELESVVRLKRLHDHLVDHALLIRQFQRELLVLRKLSHPNIIKGYEFGQSARDIFFTTEYPEGEDLKAVLRRNPLELQQVVRIFKAFLDVLAHVHYFGILHRDLKPEVIYITQDGETKVGGFGMGRMTDLSIMTMRSQLMGSPYYSSPELLSGKTLDMTSDFYSCGAILAEMLTGRRLFPQSSVVEQLQQKSKLLQHWSRHLGLEPGSEKGVLIDALLPKLLDPEPMNRWQSEHEIRDVLDSIGTKNVPVAMESGQLEELSDLSKSPDEQQCPSCGDILIEEENACLACGFSRDVVKSWGKGPYTLSLVTRYKKVVKGDKVQWKDNTIKDEAIPKMEAIKLLKIFYGDLTEDDTAQLSKEFLLAQNVDQNTAGKIEKLFSNKGLRVRKIYTGRLGKMVMKILTKLSKKIEPVKAMIIMFLIIGAIPAELMVRNSYLLKYPALNTFYLAYGSTLFTVSAVSVLAVLYAGLIWRVVIGLPSKGPDVHLIEGESATELSTVPDALTTEYNKIKSLKHRQQARHLFQQSKRFFRKLGNRETTVAVRQAVEDMQKESFRLLAALPEYDPEQEGQILSDLNRLVSRFSTADEDVNTELIEVQRDIEASLQEIDEVKFLHNRMDNRIQNIIHELNVLGNEVESFHDDELNEKTGSIITILQSLKGEIPYRKEV